MGVLRRVRTLGHYQGTLTACPPVAGVGGREPLVVCPRSTIDSRAREFSVPHAGAGTTYDIFPHAHGIQNQWIEAPGGVWIRVFA